MKTLEERIKQIFLNIPSDKAQLGASYRLVKGIINELQQKNDLLQLEKGELIKALNYIRSCDNATQSAAKAIEMLKKYAVNHD